MGIYDREYYRGDEPRGLELGSGRMMVTNLVIINVVLFIADAFIGNRHWLMDTLSASPNSLVKPYLWWQLVTYGFAHSYLDKWHIIGNMFGLWMFGRDVESVYGSREFLRIYFVTLLLGSLVWAAHSCLTLPAEAWSRYTLLGASGAVTAVILLFCVHFPRRTVLLMFILPTPAWVLGVLLIIMNLVGMQSAEGNVAYDVHLVGAAFALAYWRFGWYLGRLTPSFSALGALFKSRPKLKVHHPEESYHSLDGQADEILQKVNRSGVESLTSNERKILEDYSRRMRQKHR